MIPHSKPWLTDDDASAISEALASRMIAQGERVAEFERQIASWVRVEVPGVATASGSAALQLALAVLEIGRGDEVILPTYVCRSVLEAVLSRDATPVLADVGAEWVMTADNAAPLVTPRTRAIIVPHMYGIFADVQSFRHLGISVIEDCAQAVSYRRARGIDGHLGIFSFHPTKCLTTGEGGMLVSSDDALMHRARVLRDGHNTFTQSSRQLFSPMSDLAAALGLSQLARYEKGLDRRRALAESYASHLTERFPMSLSVLGGRGMHFRFPLHVSGGLEACEDRFRARGVIVRRGVDELLHRLCDQPDTGFPDATRHFQTTISLPIYPALTDVEHQMCIEAAEAVLAEAHTIAH